MSQCGIGSIKNKINGKTYLFKSKNLSKRWENYHALLNANKHHNKNLQNDWNEMGSNNFIFEIKDIFPEDMNLMNNRLSHFKSVENNLYNDFEVEDISKITFSYESKVLLEELHNIIGKDFPNPMFLNKLSVHNLSQNDYNDIKAEIEDLILNGEVKLGKVEEKIDELISHRVIKNQQRKIENKKILLESLSNLIGEYEHSEYYENLLEENELSKEEGDEIKIELINLINNELIDINSITQNMHFGEKEGESDLNGPLTNELNKLIESKIREKNILLKSELLDELYDLTGELDLSPQFISKLEENSFGSALGFVIRENIKQSIEEGKIKKGTVEDEIDNAIFAEKERIASENAEMLKAHLINFTGDLTISPQFKEKLDLFGLNEEIGLQIKNELLVNIENREITEVSQIDSNLDQLIEEINNQLHEITGKDSLSDSFKETLNSYNTEESLGKRIVEKLELMITNREIKRGFDFNTEIISMITVEKENSLAERLENELFKSEETIDKFNNNYLNENDITKIKAELKTNLDNCRNIEELIEFENSLDSNLDNAILRENEGREKEVLDIRQKLITELYVKLNDLSKIEIGLKDEDFEEIKETLEKTIKSDEIVNEEYNFKYDELKSLEKNGIQQELDKLVKYQQEKEQRIYDEAAQKFNEKIDVILKDDPNSYAYKKLKSNDLDNIYLMKIRKEITSVLNSNEIVDNSFETKIDEINSYTDEKIKAKVDEMIKSFKETQDSNLHNLKSLTEGINAVSFKSKLNENDLNEKAGQRVLEDLENSIRKDTINSSVDVALDNTIHKFAANKNRSLVMLNEKLGENKLNWKFISRLKQLNLADKPHGYDIKTRLKQSIEDCEVNTSNLDSSITEELNKEIEKKNNQLKVELDNLIGKGNNINNQFLSEISKDNLNIEDAREIKKEILEQIDGNNLEKDELKKTLDRILDNRKEERRVYLLENKLFELIGENEPSSSFLKKLHDHDLTRNEWFKIKNNILKLISSKKIELENIETKINRQVEQLEKDDLKNEIDKLSNEEIDDLLTQFGISSLMPFKSSKISKLVDKVKIPILKGELNKSKYKTKNFNHVSVYNSDFSSESNSSSNEQFCTYCGEKLEADAMFCTHCGNRVNNG